jgi:hypothetical protein
MSYKIISIGVFIFLLSSIRGFAQTFDSIHVYAVYMKSMYRIKIDKDLIKNETEPIVLTGEKEVNSVNTMLSNTIKGKEIKKLKSNHLDIRLYFEFFKNDRVVQTIGVTPYKTMFIDHTLYTYDDQKLKCLDKYIAGLSKVLGIGSRKD